MKILCDRHVAPRYVNAFQRTDWLKATRVSDHLPVDASDADIIGHAEEHGQVVFTADKRFLMDDSETEVNERERIEADCGIIFYDQRQKPSSSVWLMLFGKLHEAMRTILKLRRGFLMGGYLTRILVSTNGITTGHLTVASYFDDTLYRSNTERRIVVRVPRRRET